MASSSLVNDVVLADAACHGGTRTKITNICIHHMAGVLTAKECGRVFTNPSRRASAHYGVGKDLRVGLYVDESLIAWHAGNAEENKTSIGIEISDAAYGGDWPVADDVLSLAIKLIADCMKRNGIKQAVKGQTLTYHSMFSATACPGDYLRSKMDYICAEVNKILSGGATPTPTPKRSFFPAKGYWGPGDYDERIDQLSAFMYKTFPSYTKKEALGSYYGKNIQASIREFQKRTHLETDGCTGPITLKELEKYGFKWK